MPRYQLLIEDYDVTPFVISRLTYVMAKRVKKYLLDPPECVLEFVNGNVKWYADMDDWDRTAQKIVTDLIQDPSKFVSFNQSLDQDIKMLKKLSREVYFQNIKPLQASDLFDLYAKLTDQFELVYERGMLPTFSDLGEPFLTNRLKEILHEHVADNADELFVLLTTPSKLSEMAKEELELEKLARNSSVRADSTLVQDHADKYFWLTFGYEGPAYGMAEIWSRIQELRRAPKPEDYTEPPDTTGIYKDLNFDEYTKAIFDVVRDWVSLKGTRKEAFFACYAAADRIAEAFSAELNVPKKRVKFSTKAELQAAAKDHILPQNLDERFKRAIYLWKDGADQVLVGADAEAFLRQNLGRDHHQAIGGVIKGQIAFMGLVQGIVKIIKQPSDMSKMNQGDILVSPATNPNLLPAMQKAAAFVTDVGGITCHAAIMAREMRKPCIVGTKIATRVLKDGDMVEVDATRGIVTVIVARKG